MFFIAPPPARAKATNAVRLQRAGLFVFPNSLFLLSHIIARAVSIYIDGTFRGDGYD
jgi:hypothetical protein